MPRPYSSRFRARWIFPIEAPPLESGVVTIGEGRILAVERGANRKADYDLGDVAVLPGLVNAHMHLDLSSLSGSAPTTKDFSHWLKAVIQQRRSFHVDQVVQNIRAGLKQSLASGTTLLGDISNQGLSWDVLAEAPACRAVVFHELLGLPRARAHQAWSTACAWSRTHPGQEACRPGLSPHAPYSVRASLFRAAARLSKKQRIPLAIHLAETREELELLEHHSGSFVPFLSELGVWDANGLIKDVEELLRLTEESASVLFIHGNYLDSNVAFPRGATVIYCPRTHAAFGHAPYPLRNFLANGVRVALGTDSLASNPDLDVLAEARCVHRLYPDLPGATVLRMATLSGAEALGWQDETGSLTPGKSADVVLLQLPAEQHSDPHELILSSPGDVQAVLFRGRWVYQRGDCRLPGGIKSEERENFNEPGLQET
jgi:cytosine/adenosine deaminase-related metal-dependent hydrolase